MGEPEVLRRVNRALDKFWEKQRHKITVGVGEPSICVSLRDYLKEEFPNYDIDNEFNRIRDDPKRVKLKGNDGIRRDVTVKPDIIVHKEGTKRNYVAIEVKRPSSYSKREYLLERAFAIQKLKRYKRDPRLLYKHAFFIEFPTGHHCSREDILVKIIR